MFEESKMKKLAVIFVSALMISVTAVAAPVQVNATNSLDSVQSSFELKSKEPKKTKTGGIHIRF
tara:strand:+ start:20225 stop:20416 length:192 start_codon:yes stop_codon:yes gene_type:complete